MSLHCEGRPQGPGVKGSIMTASGDKHSSYKSYITNERKFERLFGILRACSFLSVGQIMVGIRPVQGD